jgi:hypothetical protein
MPLNVNPKLALIPSGYKVSKVYSVLPTDGSGDFVFKRGGNYYTDSGNGTRVNKAGLLELVSANVPRLNYPLIDGVVQDCPSLLLEPQGSNFVTYSEDFTQGAWVKLGTSVVSDNAMSPSGTTSADSLIELATLSEHLSFQNHSITSGSTYTFSVYAKYNGRVLQIYGSGTQFGFFTYANFDLQNGILGAIGAGASAKIISFGDGWYLCSITCVATSGGSGGMAVALVTSTTSTRKQSYLGDGLSGAYLWGAQAEAESYATSYIPTQGAISTRVAESAKNAGTTNIYNDSEGVLYLEVENINSDPIYWRTVCINNGGTSNNRVSISYSNGYIRGNVKVNDSIQFQSSKLIDPNSKHKIAVKYNNNDFGFYVDGEIIKTQNFGFTFTENTLSKIDFDEGKGFTASPFYGNVNDLRYYETALTDLQLQELTTL